MQNQSQPQTNINTDDRDASVQISAEQLDRIAPKMRAKFWALPDYMQQTIIQSVCSFPIWSANGTIDSDRELIEHYFEPIGIIGFASPIIDMARALAVPEITPENDPSRPVYDLELSTRIQNALINDGIQSLGQLAQASADRVRLLKIPYIGKLALRQINEVLVANGYAAKE